ncbi:hypothetical protein E4V42_08170 [Clostridium estertheticum]|uniref:Fibronectin type-III domain-containing protein n=1 Tax=Clostridium estertheticum TaxID=238834 RepID=A0A5N7IMC2_9CLOT|nr:hypothetical protein [Clostridium estertheticum]MPQ31412.1 hypothetical protein [Clostridium estertheticum]MPQ62085.1 hypothetical protein [Clostridium estertheticum]
MYRKKISSISILILFFFVFSIFPMESVHAATSISVPEALTVVPAVPSKVIVDKAGWSVVQLTSSSTSLAIGCNVYRSDAKDGTYALLGKATKANNDYHYKDTNLTAHKNYFYKFAAFNYIGESQKTAAVKVTTKKVIHKPSTPIGLTLNSIVASAGIYKVRIDWTYTYGATSYNVYRSTSERGAFIKIGTSTNGLYIDSNSGAANAMYYYKVSAVNVSGESALSEVIPAKLTATFRAVPTGLSVNSQAAINLSWAIVTGSTGYNVYRAAKVDYAYSKIGTSTNVTYKDTKAAVGVEYLYKVSSIDENGESLKSTEVTGKLADSSVTVLSEAVKDLEYKYESKDKLKLTWDALKNATSYNIYKSLYKDMKYTYVGSTNKNKYVDEKSVDSATYYYKVVAVNAGGESSKVNPLTVGAKVVLKRQMENIDRGINAVKAANGVLVSWRLLGTEAQDLEFDVYRDNVKINSKPIKSSTNYLDAKGTTTSKYYVRTIGGKSKESQSETVTAWENNYKELPIRKPAAGINKAGEIYDYTANDASVADLDGDGKYEIVLNWAPTNAKDNSQAGYTGNTYIDAYKLDGTFMWRIDLGKNIRSGAHYTDIMVYDFDGDGKAELTTRTADGTIDGEGNIIGDEDKDYSNAKGYILDGPEYHTMFEGATGKALDTQAYEPQRGAFATDINEWGDTYGNRGDRFIASVAYLDGKTPSVVMQRGYYTRMAIVAYGFKKGKFVKQWTFDSQFDEVDPNGLKYTEYRGQGNHNVSVGDVDADGMDEIITGAAVINQDGKALYTTKLGHGDAMHFGDLDPTNPGLEIYQVQEEKGSPYGMDIRDAGTGKILFGVKSGIDTGRGLSADIDPNYIGEEIWAIDGAWNSSTGGLYSVKGEKISEGIPSSNFAIWWDGDLQRELLDHNWNGYGGPASPGTISKWDYVNKKSVNILTATGTNSNNGTKGNPCLQADLFGDWREEVIWRTEDSSALRIYATSDVTETKLPTLMHDPIYRLGVAFQNTGYNQPPHTSYYLGSGMKTPPQPNITISRGGTEVKIK